MWINRIISSFFGIRKKSDLKNDLKNISLKKLILLFVMINVLFISIILLITKIFI